jgi:hypothetical protein
MTMPPHLAVRRDRLGRFANQPLASILASTREGLESAWTDAADERCEAQAAGIEGQDYDRLRAEEFTHDEIMDTHRQIAEATEAGMDLNEYRLCRGNGAGHEEIFEARRTIVDMGWYAEARHWATHTEIMNAVEAGHDLKDYVGMRGNMTHDEAMQW